MKTIVVLEQPEINQLYSHEGFLMTLANGQQLVIKAETGTGTVYGPLKLKEAPDVIEEVSRRMGETILSSTPLTAALSKPKRKYTRRTAAKVRIPPAKTKKPKRATAAAGRVQCPHCEKTYASTVSFCGHRRSAHPDVPTRQRRAGSRPTAEPSGAKTAANTCELCDHRTIAHKNGEGECLVPGCVCWGYKSAA